MYQVQKIKDAVFKQLEESGAYRNITAQLKSQVLNIVESQSQQKKNKLGFSYEHPLLPKLLKYEHSKECAIAAALCLDLIQQFLESFKFEYTLNVFLKEINRTQKISRQDLTHKLGLKEKAHQPVLISLVSADEKVLKPSNATTSKEPNKAAAASSSAAAKQHAQESVKKPATTQQKKEEPKEEPQPVQPPKKKIATIPSTAPPEVKADKEEKKTAEDFLRGILSKAPPPPENKPAERAVSAPPAILKKEPPPPESGVNKIRGGVSNKPSPLSALLGLAVTSATTSSVGGAKDPYAYDLKKGGSPFGKKSKSSVNSEDEDIEEEIDEFQNSQNSSYSRRNPLFSSTENSGMYDQSVNSVEIEDYDYYESVRRRKK